MMGDACMSDVATDAEVLTSFRPIYQPLHPSVRYVLDPEYVAFHDRYVQYVEPENWRPWDASVRRRQPWPYAGIPKVVVGRIEDIRLFDRFEVRIFIPAGDSPAGGWPVLLWMHGGGWAIGDIDGDNDFCSLVCRDVQTVVVNIAYRLAPEHKFPAGLTDCIDAVRWASSTDCSSKYHTNSTKVAVGGASAGANIATVTSLTAIDMGLRLAGQVLIVPVIDNTATTRSSWKNYPHAPWLTPHRLMWYRRLYFTSRRMSRNWRVSPRFAPRRLISSLPPTFIATAGQDMLCVEGRDYASRLSANKVKVKAKCYPGMPHSMMSLSGVLSQGRQCMQDVIGFLQDTFDTRPSLPEKQLFDDPNCPTPRTTRSPDHGA